MQESETWVAIKHIGKSNTTCNALTDLSGYPENHK